jgi:hypothetical protein
MAQHYSPRLVTDNLVMCLDPSQNKSYPTTDLPVKGGLVMWMDAADDSTFSYSSGTTVSQWRDKSGFNYHGTPLTAGPTRSSSLNSRKVLTFTTSQSIGNLSFTMETSANTVFVVSRLTGTTNSRVLTAYYNNWLLGHWGGLVNPYYAEGWVYYPPNAADTTWRMYMGDWGGPSNDLAAAYSNGTVLTSGSTVASAGPKGLGINFQGGEPSTCEAAEIIVFNRLLTIPERRLIHTYLGQKWGILNTDRSIIDLSGFNDNGLLGNGTTANMPVYDHDNKSLRFDGANDYVFLANNQLNISSAITVEAWVKYNAQGGYNARSYSVITCKGYPWTWLLEDQGGQFNFRISTSVTADSNVNSSYSHGLNTWDHVVGTYDGATQRIYVDGALRASTSLTGTINTSSNDALVGSYNYGDYCLTGNIGAVRVYSRALSAAEIAQNYEAQKSKFANTIIQQGLILNIDAANPYSYGGAGTTVYDTSNTALSWTATNVTYNSDPIKYFSFNGSNSSLVSSTSTAYDSQTITMECWCYPNSLNQLGFLFEKGAVNSQYSMFFSTTNTFYFRTIGGTINNQDLTFTTTTYLTVSAWNHIVCTYNGSSKVIYVNGAQIASVAASGTLQTGQTNQYIGKYGNAGDNYPFNGRIAQSRVYNIALSAAQVLQNYNATKGRFGL